MTTQNSKELFFKINKGISEGVRKAVHEHKIAGHSISIWRNGKVEEIPADQIQMPEDSKTQ